MGNMYNSFEIKTSPFSNPSHLQKLIYYPIWKFIGVIGVYTDGSITKSFTNEKMFTEDVDALKNDMGSNVGLLIQEMRGESI